MEVPTIAAKVADGERKKVIYIAGKILNIVVS
jgi:hypothetical protein